MVSPQSIASGLSAILGPQGGEPPPLSPLPPGVSLSDIPYDLAVSAYSGTSMSPERRARGEQREYAQAMLEGWGELQKRAATDEQRASIPEIFERYRREWLSRKIQLLQVVEGIFGQGPRRGYTGVSAALTWR